MKNTKIQDHKTYLNSFGNKFQINSYTFKKQKSPPRKINKETKYISSRSEDLTDDEKDLHQKVKKSERQREEDRRRMQFEMRKREQELLAKIKDQQKELEAIKCEKTEVEKALKRKNINNSEKIDPIFNHENSMVS